MARKHGFSLPLWRGPIAALSKGGGVPGPTPWDGNVFTSSKSWGVAVLDGYSTQTTSLWDTAITSTRLDFHVAAGVDTARIVFGIEAAMGAADLAALDDIWAVAAHAIDSVIAKGMKVILVLFPRLDSSGTYPADDIEADYPSGPKWLRLLEIEEYFTGKVDAIYTNEQVELEPYNENQQALSGNWPDMVQAVWDKCRSVSLNVALSVGGSDYSGVPGLADLDASSFDANTRFRVAMYEPFVFTHQNVGINADVHSLHYPPIASDKAAAIAAAPSATSQLTAYFDTPQDKAWLDSFIDGIETWRTANSVAASRISIGEYGNVGGYPGSEGDGGRETARAKWYQDASLKFIANGYSRSLWSYASPSRNDFTDDWVPEDVYLVANGFTPSTSYDSDASALAARFTTPPTAARMGLINAVVKMLKYAGIWSISDAIYFLAAADAQAAQRNWKQNAYNLTPGGTLTFTANQGYKGNGSTGYLNTGFYPGVAASNLARDSATLGISIRTAPTSGETQFYDQAGKIGIGLGGGYSREILNAAPGAAEAYPAGPSPAKGLLLVTRNNGSQIVDYVNGSKGTTSSQTSVALAGAGENWNTLELFRAFGGTYSDAEADFAIIASGMTDTMAKDLWTIQQFYKDGLARAA